MSEKQVWRLALPMYNVTPELAKTWEALLHAVISGLRERGWTDTMEVVKVPEDLMAFWRSPDVLLTQTCGYPYVTQLKDDVHMIAAPEFDFPGCTGVSYRSVMVVPEAGVNSLEALRGKVAAINQPDSQSGMNSLRHTIAPLACDGVFFSRVMASGSHLGSLAALQVGLADVAAIDCITFAYAQLHDPEKVAGLRVLLCTEPVPGLPLIASRALKQAQLEDMAMVLDALSKTHSQLLASLKLKKITPVAQKNYEIISCQEALAVQLGYPFVV